MSEKNSWYQGVFIPQHPEKCINKNTIEYRSSWESRFCNWLDQNSSVIRWGYEVVSIPYRYDIDGRNHTYIVDFYAEILNKNNHIDKYLIEIKPKNQGEKPSMPKKKSMKSMKNYFYEAHNYIKNQNKWTSAQSFCQANGMIFKVLTKENLF